jgi:hypothetical protein
MITRRWPNASPPKSEAAEDDKYPAYDETLTSGIEDTVRNLKVLTERSHPDTEWQHYQLQAFRDLTKEVQQLRKDHAKLLEAVKHKASRKEQEEFQRDLTALLDKKVQNLWRYAVAPLFAIAAFICGKVLMR